MSQLSNIHNLQGRRKNLYTKLVPLLTLPPIFGIAITLLYLQITQRQNSEPFAFLIKVDQAKVAISIQLLSGLLGTIEIFVLCAILRLSYSCYASQKQLPLRSLQFAFAVNAQTFTWYLPPIRLALLLGSMAIALLPAAIWSGAITPFAVGYNSTHMIDAPTFQSSSLSSLWDPDPSMAELNNSGIWQTETGVFSFDPAPIKGLLLNQASEASVTTPGNMTHAKLDQTGFVYRNRSYGMGAAAGLVNLSDAVSTVQAISYVDEGFESAVSCLYNATSAYSLQSMTSGDSLFSIYRVQGFYPTGEKFHVGGEEIHAGRNPYNLFSWGAAYSSSEKALYLSMATPATASGGEFSLLNTTQCKIQFTPRSFSIHADYINNQISVTPGAEIQWPTTSDEVIKKIGNWLWGLSYTDGGFGGSQLGRSLLLNINKLQTSNNTVNTSNDTTMQAIEDHVGSLVDNILIRLISARMVIGNHSVPIKMQVTAPAIKLGDLRFIIGVLAVNFVLLLLYCAEALRTRFWEKYPDVDLFDLTGLVKGISDGSLLITQDSETNRQRQGSDLCVSVLTDTGVEIEKGKLLDRIVSPG